MQWTGLNELREKYLHYFEGKGHLRLGSFPLVPKDDPSLLLINSGMAPMKKWFLGQEEPPRHRVTTCQKCIRTPDIERVGITARHGCFFEMLGNFSFQDYFKKEVIPWAWEFLTKELEIPADRLYISVYQDDDEAYDIWTKSVGIPEDHMVRLGKEDNFWEHGSGPCGPCSEIYFDRGLKYGCGKPTCGVGCDCDRFMEIWNLVFSQYDSDGKGTYALLPKPNIDTGMGLERLAVVMQDVDNLFEVDTVAAVLHHVERISGKQYGANEKDDISIRVITDHIRATVFMASDGILPSNEGRGYVMRRLLRRAARHGRMLGIDHPFLTDLVDTVIISSEVGYPELREHESYIKKVIGTEEERFYKTIDSGMNILNGMIQHLHETNKKILSGLDVFKLNDTFGFPIDLTKEIAAEAGLGIDEAAFHVEMTRQRERARAQAVTAELKEANKQLEIAKAKLASSQIDGLFQNAVEVDGVRIVTVYLNGTTPDTLRSMMDKLRDKEPNAVGALIGTDGGKTTLAVGVGKNALARGLKAGALVKQIAAIAGGNGGGKPDFAMAGIRDTSKIDDALNAVEGIVKENLEKAN